MSILGEAINLMPQCNALISVQGVDCTAAIAPFLKDVRFSDRIAFKPDNLEIILADPSRLFLNEWQLEKGMKISVTLVRYNFNYPGEIVQRGCGMFEVDAIDFSWGAHGSELVVQCTSIPLNSTVNTQKKARRWEGASLKSMAQQICSESGMTLQYEASFNPTWKGVDQIYQSDLVMLAKKAESSGLMMKVTNTSIVIFDEAEYEQKEPVRTFIYGVTPIISGHLSTKSFDTYGSCKVSYMNPKTGEATTQTVTPNDAPPTKAELVSRQKPDWDEDDPDEDEEDVAGQ